MRIATVRSCSSRNESIHHSQVAVLARTHERRGSLVISSSPLHVGPLRDRSGHSPRVSTITGVVEPLVDDLLLPLPLCLLLGRAAQRLVPRPVRSLARFTAVLDQTETREQENLAVMPPHFPHTSIASHSRTLPGTLRCGGGSPTARLLN